MFTDNYTIARYLCTLFYEVNDAFVIFTAVFLLAVMIVPYFMLFRFTRKTIEEMKREFGKDRSDNS